MITKERRIPTILALLIVFLGIGGTAFLVEHFQNVKTAAQPPIVPQDVKITNLTSSGFTVSWVTGEEATGFIVFGEETSFKETAYDERDDEGNLGKYLTHHVSLKNLKPACLYYFKIISQGKSFDHGGAPFEVKTAPTFKTPPSQVEPAYGTILAQDNTPSKGAIVYLTLKGSLPLSTLTKSSGNFLIPLNLAVRSDLGGYLIFEERHEEEILVRAGVDSIAEVLTDTQNDSPIPTIILGKSYDFLKQKSKKEESLAEKETSLGILGKTTSQEVEILFPRQGAVLLDQRPLFKGTGIPNQEVIIKIESSAMVEKVVVDQNGWWLFRTKEPLSPGTHTLTITTKNEKGEKVNLSRQFQVLKSGTQVLGEATPSATLTPTPSPTAPTATPTPLILTPTPTPSLVPGVFLPTAGFLGLGGLLLLIGMGMAFVFQ